MVYNKPHAHGRRQKKYFFLEKFNFEKKVFQKISKWFFDFWGIFSTKNIFGEKIFFDEKKNGKKKTQNIFQNHFSP